MGCHHGKDKYLARLQKGRRFRRKRKTQIESSRILVTSSGYVSVRKEKNMSKTQSSRKRR